MLGGNVQEEGDFTRSGASWAVKASDFNPWIKMSSMGDLMFLFMFSSESRPVHKSVKLEFSSRFEEIQTIQYRLYNLNLVYKFNYKI